MSTYEEILDGNNGVSWYQLFVYIWATLGNVVHTQTIAFMVFGCMQPTPINGTNETYFQFDSVAKEWDLVGTRKGIATTLASVAMAGLSIGRPVMGLFSDRYGRKAGVYVTLVSIAICNAIIYFSTSWLMLAPMLFFLGFSGGGLIVAKSVLASESFVQRWRLSFQILGPPLGYLFWDLLACFVATDWRTLSILMLIPIPPYLLLTFRPMRESPKWLMEERRFGEALQELESIARFNRRELGYNMDDIKDVCRKHVKGNLKDLFSSKRLTMYVLIASYSHFTAAVVYYGMLYGAGKLVGSFFVNFAIMYILRLTTTSTLIVAEILFSKIGRKTMHKFGLTVVIGCTTTAAVVSAVPGWRMDYSIVTRIAGLLTVGASGALWSSVHMYNTELFPSLVRSQATGMTGFLGGIGGVVGPQILLLFDVWESMPCIALAALALVNILLVHFLIPETKGKPLPDFIRKEELSEDTSQAIL